MTKTIEQTARDWAERLGYDTFVTDIARQVVHIVPVPAGRVSELVAATLEVRNVPVMAILKYTSNPDAFAEESERLGCDDVVAEAHAEGREVWDALASHVAFFALRADVIARVRDGVGFDGDIEGLI